MGECYYRGSSNKGTRHEVKVDISDKICFVFGYLFMGINNKASCIKSWRLNEFHEGQPEVKLKDISM
jgi:hypothetical protein